MDDICEAGELSAELKVRKIALATSGFGPSFGGIGVVSLGVAQALSSSVMVDIWQHRPEWPRLCRSAAFVLGVVARSIPPPDFIIFTHVDLARVAVTVPWLWSVPYAVFIYGVEVWRPLDRWRRAALERATTVLAISRYTEKRAKLENPWLPHARVVWLGTDLRRPRLRSDLDRVVLIVGRMARDEQYKGHDAVIDAWPQVVAAVPEARLIIAGDGDDRGRLQRRAASIPSISFTGFVSNERLEALLRTSMVLVSLSTGEGFGLAALEAAAIGVPIVALSGTVTEELFPGGCGHVLLESTDVRPLTRALITLLKNPDYARKIGDAGRQRMTDTFTTSHFCQRLRMALNF